MLFGPLVRTEVKIGYAWVSTGGQKPERQLDALTAAGCQKVFADKKPGKNALRPELEPCHAFLDPGDTLVVPSLDRSPNCGHAGSASPRVSQTSTIGPPSCWCAVWMRSRSSFQESQ
ncbi:recombinase family protein [Streptomyces olivaceoviridis]|uniref:recombinase family protein n=1 Tax=Streptomyces olivaceoviridis TaxID=1921 RepID=UPI003D9E8061